MADNQPENRELDSYLREKEEEGRRINEGKAHKPAEPERRTFQGLEAARASMRRSTSLSGKCWMATKSANACCGGGRVGAAGRLYYRHRRDGCGPGVQ